MEEPGRFWDFRDHSKSRSCAMSCVNQSPLLMCHPTGPDGLEVLQTLSFFLFQFGKF